MHPVIPRDTNAQKSIHCQLIKSHYLTIATPICVESTAKLGMMVCTIAIVFKDHQRLERLCQFYTKYCIYYSYYSTCSIVCAVTTKTLVYTVLCVKLIYSLRPLNIITCLGSPGLSHYYGLEDSNLLPACLTKIKVFR